MNMKRKPMFVALVIVLNASSANALGDHPGGHHADSQSIGLPGGGSRVNRTIEVEMRDTMRFTPAEIQVSPNETIRFVVKNLGKMRHEMILGKDQALKAHNEEMKKAPEMVHADKSSVTVLPGQAGEIVWTFVTAGTVNFACLQPGHFDAGMKGSILVGKKSTNQERHPEHKH
jgi:uncharacterized cupredoxin-like copper-binding protein